jgi:hypothetical protein
VHARPKRPVPVLARRPHRATCDISSENRALPCLASASGGAWRGAARRQQQRSTRGRGGEEAILEAAGPLIAAVNEGSPRDLGMRQRGGLAAATNRRPAC